MRQPSSSSPSLYSPSSLLLVIRHFAVGELIGAVEEFESLLVRFVTLANDLEKLVVAWTKELKKSCYIF